MTKPRWIGLDVGGANLKIADGAGRAASIPFALWREPEKLAKRIRGLMKEFVAPHDDAIALTMTGELCDCYATKAEGVAAIVAATVEAAPRATVRVATVDDGWLSPEDAVARPERVAAANWRVAARLVARWKPRGRSLWLDVGSTTVDAIPTEGCRVVATGKTDTERLIAGELVYSGVRRTPICAIASMLSYRGAECPAAAEWFATTADAWLLAGELKEDPDDTSTADGRPLLLPNSVARLARMVCADASAFDHHDAVIMAGRVVDAQVEAIAKRLTGETPDRVVLSGEGDFLGRRVAERLMPDAEVILWSDVVGPEASRCAPAHAAAALAREELA